jgi:hypothetical protein
VCNFTRVPRAIRIPFCPFNPESKSKIDSQSQGHLGGLAKEVGLVLVARVLQLAFSLDKWGPEAAFV